MNICKLLSVSKLCFLLSWEYILYHLLGYYSAHHINVFSMLFIIIFPCTTGVPGRPEITGFTKPAMEGDVITLTCTTLGSKPAANIRWFRNNKEVQGKHVVWISQSIVSSLTLLETSLLSSHSAAAFFCAHIHALFCWPLFSSSMILLAHSQHCCYRWKLSKCCWTVAEQSTFHYPTKVKTYRSASY